MKTPLISVIILNWNGKKYLKDCFSSLQNQTYPNLEIILVDNGSFDGSVDFVNKLFPKVKTIKNEKNLGFAQGNNIGIKACKGEYVFILNNDTKVNRVCLEKMIEAAVKNPKIGMLAPKIVSFENPQLIDSLGLNIYFDGLARGRHRGKLDNNQYGKDILMPSAAAALYQKGMLNEIGLFDESFFAYCEDTDLGLRARLAGFSSVLVPEAVVWHHYSATFGKYSELKAFLTERNHFWAVFKNFPARMLILVPFYTIIRYVSLIQGAVIKKGPVSRFESSKLRLLLILIKAYGSAIKKMPSILRKRRIIQKNKKISAKEFYNLVKKNSLKVSELTLKE